MDYLPEVSKFGAIKQVLFKQGNKKAFLFEWIWNTPYQNLQHKPNIVLEEEIYRTNCLYLKRFQINTLSFYHKKLGKEEQVKTKVGRIKEEQKSVKEKPERL